MPSEGGQVCPSSGQTVEYLPTTSHLHFTCSSHPLHSRRAETKVDSRRTHNRRLRQRWWCRHSSRSKNIRGTRRPWHQRGHLHYCPKPDSCFWCRALQPSHGSTTTRSRIPSTPAACSKNLHAILSNDDRSSGRIVRKWKTSAAHR